MLDRKRSPGSDLFEGVVPFVATAEARSFRAAARRLGVTPSAVSKAVAKLEGELGVRLLHRTSRTVSLTTEGEGFLRRCREAVDQLEAGREALVQARAAPRGRLRVSLPTALGNRVVAPSLPRLLERYPELELELVLTDRYVGLSEESVDVAVRIGVLEDAGAVRRALRSPRWVTCGAPSYLARRGAPSTPADLGRHACLRFLLASGVPRDWSFGKDAATVRVGGGLVADGGEALVAAAVGGAGLVQAFDFMVREDLAAGRLVEVLREHAAPGPPLAALCAPGRQNAPNVRAFLEHVTDVLGR